MSSQQVVTPQAYIETYTGQFINLLDPKPADIHIDDIVTSLSRAPRFAGHTLGHRTYSVAQHSVLVWRLLQEVTGKVATPKERRDLLWLGLLHDATEAYLVDVPTPLKMVPGIKETYLRLEHQLMNVILEALFTPEDRPAFDESSYIWQLVKEADMLALAIEAHHLMPSGGKTKPFWNLAVEPAPGHLALHRGVVSQEEAERQFRHALAITARLQDVGSPT